MGWSTSVLWWHLQTGEGRACVYTYKDKYTREVSEQHLHSSIISPCNSLLHLSLPNSPPCPRQGCGYILGSLHRGVREGGCMCARIQTGQVRCSSMKISLLSHSFSLFFSHFFLSFSIPPNPVSFVPHGTGSTSRTRPGSFRWNEPCGNWLVDSGCVMTAPYQWMEGTMAGLSE